MKRVNSKRWKKLCRTFRYEALRTNLLIISVVFDFELVLKRSWLARSDIQLSYENSNFKSRLTCAVIFLNKSFLALSILLPLVAPNEIFSSNF